MKRGKYRLDRRHKNQLIPESLDKPEPWFLKPIFWVGCLLLAASVVWAIFLCVRATPPLFHEFSQDTEYLEILEHHSHFGHAALAPLELATFGAVILSFIHLIRELEGQQHTEMTRFQPVVTCVALLDYSVLGVKSDEKVDIHEPRLKLRIRNLGDSPATFINVDNMRLTYTPNGPSRPVPIKLKNQSIHIDSLAKHASGVNESDYEAELALCEQVVSEAGPKAGKQLVREAEGQAGKEKRKAKPEEKTLVKLIAGILESEDAKAGKLELALTVAHENVMGLRYFGEGTFGWSHELCNEDKSDPEQIEYIKEFRKARASKSRSPAKPYEKGEINEKTIGHFIRYSAPLQAALEYDAVQKVGRLRNLFRRAVALLRRPFGEKDRPP
jgi:hypothetical protein